MICHSMEAVFTSDGTLLVITELSIKEGTNCDLCRL